MKLIKVISSYHMPVYINPEYIVTITELYSGKVLSITFIDGSTVQINMTYNEFKNLKPE